MIDTHAHLDAEDFNQDRPEVLERAFANGVEYIIIPAIEPNGFNNLLHLVTDNEKIYCGLGIHPHHATQATIDDYTYIERNSENPKVIAIGEIGLDYYYNFAPQKIQKDVFRWQLQLAKSRNLPVIVHNRDSDEDLLSIISDEQNGSLRGVLHCFSSSVSTLNKALDLGFKISFTGNITFKKTDLSEVVRLAPLDSIMLETDSPYMAPVPNRGKRNEPSFIKLIAEKIAEYKSIPIGEVIKMTTYTAKKLFKLPIICFLILLPSIYAFSQGKNDKSQPTDIFDDTKQPEYYNPYEKFIGLGGFIGSNTIVQTEFLKTGKQQSITYEGVLFSGGNITISPVDFLLIQGSYLYSKNVKIIEYDKLNRLVLGPTIYEVWEFSTIWIANPFSRVNFFATVGPTLFSTTIDKGVINETTQNVWGINSGIGFIINIPIKSAGLINITGEWRLNFDITKSKVTRTGDDPEHPEIVEASSFFSMPRIGLIWYMPFVKRW